MLDLIKNKHSGFYFSLLFYRGGKLIVLSLPGECCVRYQNERNKELGDEFVDSILFSKKVIFMVVDIGLTKGMALFNWHRKKKQFTYSIPNLLFGKEKRIVEVDLENPETFVYTSPKTGFCFELTRAKNFLKRPRSKKKVLVKDGWWVKALPNDAGKTFSLRDDTLVVVDIQALEDLVGLLADLPGSLRQSAAYFEGREGKEM